MNTDSHVAGARFGAAAGIGFVVLLLVGNGLTEAGAPTADTDEAALEYLQLLATGSNRIGLAMELLGFGLMAAFIARLHSALRDAEGPGAWLPGFALIGGVLTLAVKLSWGAGTLAALWQRDEIDAAAAALLLDVGDAAFLVTCATFGLLLLGAGASAFSSGLLPRWLSIGGIVAGGVASLGLLATDSLDAGPGIIGWLLGLVWVVATSIVLLRDSRTSSAPLAGSAAPTSA